MHPYLGDEQARIRVFLIAAFLSVITARVFYVALGYLPFSIPWWIETPSVLGFFWRYVWLFDNHLWRMRVMRRLGWLYIPNLNGNWLAEIKSSYSGFDRPIQARVLIRQTASRMSVSLESETSLSHSIQAALMRTDRLSRFELVYNYVNSPKPDSVATMSIHQGTTWLRISEDGDVLDGEYYSGRDRQSFGRITLRHIRS